MWKLEWKTGVDAAQQQARPSGASRNPVLTQNNRLPASQVLIKDIGLGYGLLLITAFALAACSASDAQLTAKAQYDLAGVQIANLRSTATVAYARMQTTQDFAVMRVTEVSQAGQSLRSTLAALGAESGFIETLSSSIAAFTPSPGLPATAGSGAALRTRSPDRPAAVRTPPSATGEAGDRIAADSQPRLENIALAAGKDEKGCAIDPNPRFTPASAEIYVVARAYHIPADVTISSSWRRMGAEVALISFQAAYPIHDRCIWLFIDQSDTPFVSGRWSVELRLDGQSMALVPFQIFEN